MRKSVLLAWTLIVFLFSLNLVEAQDSVSVAPDRPDVSSWNLVARSNIGIRVSDKVMYYLGFDITYQNPVDTKEFVREIRVLLPFLVAKSNNVADRNFIDMAVVYMTDGSERELLKNYALKSDPILYIRWKEEPDVKRGTIKLDGDNEIWLWNAYGTWVHHQGVTVGVEVLSEPFKELDDKLIIVGLKYFFDNKNYIAREMPYSYLILALKPPKKGK